MFKQARFKLTAWYLLIIMIISFSFSGLIYRLIDTEINRFATSQRNRFERRLELPRNAPRVIFVDDDLITESRRRLLINLLIINGIIFIVSGSFSYFLAGKTLSPIQKAIDDQKRFISDASHELRTPLTALKSHFEVSLRDPKLNLLESKKVIATGILQANKLKNLSDSLLELSHFDTQQPQANFEPVSLKQVVLESINQLKPKATAKKIKIINQVHLAKIKGDFNKLVEMFIVFIDNAIKYSHSNSQVKLISKIKNNQVVIKIIDYGIGISQSDLPHIFDRFYQANNARTKGENDGYGLGLSIAQNIIKLHRGKIEVKSKLNIGTTFIIYLPLFS